MLPLATVSKTKRVINTLNDSTELRTTLREQIMAATRWLSNVTDRRFDWRYQTLWHNARKVTDGGAVSGARLLLADDLQELTELKNGDGAVIDAADYLLEPERPTAYKNMVMLVNTGLYWTWQTDRPAEKAICVTGFWGYGGRFTKKGLTLTNAIATDDTTLTLTGSTAVLEQDMLLRIGEELLLIEALAGATLTVERAFNDSIAAEHAADSVVRVFSVDEQVAWCVVELVSWMRQMENAGGFGKVVVGDGEQTIQLDALPKNLRDAILLLRRRPRIRGI